MLRYCLHRLVVGLAMLLALTVLIFTLLQLTPGDPIDAYIDPNVAMTKEAMDALRARLGLDQPLPVQYLAWLSQAAQGNLGHSLQRFNETVAGLILSRIGPTFLLMGAGISIAIVIGIAGGCVLAGKLSQHRVNFTLVRVGAWLLVVLLALLAIPGQGRFNLLGHAGTLVTLLLLGASAGLFAVPLQVFLQTRPPPTLKGRTIATANLANWVAIIASAGIYALFDVVVNALKMPRATIFALTSSMYLRRSAGTDRVAPSL